jgi:hypothetical protein
MFANKVLRVLVQYNKIIYYYDHVKLAGRDQLRELADQVRTVRYQILARNFRQ